MPSTDLEGEFNARVREAAEKRTPLVLRGGGSKAFYGNAASGTELDLRGHAGIVSYEPTELVITARGGTPLAEVVAALAEHGQRLAFEPPCYGAGGTLGGCVAAGLAGPARASAGGVRDFVLGAKLLDGRGQRLRFGGSVMKNVAGYDVSRLLAGSLGTLGILLEVSLKVLPIPSREATVALDMEEAAAIAAVNRWQGAALPISASAWQQERLTLRFSGAAAAVANALATVGGTELAAAEAAAHWAALRDQRDRFFDGAAPLWRLGVQATTAPLGLGETLVEWLGGQRWIRGDHDPRALREAAAKVGGHATAFRGAQPADGVFPPLAAGALRLHRHLKEAFDPAGVFNRGRLVPDL